MKWIATAVLTLGTLVNGFGYYPHGPLLLLLGGIIWLGVAIEWREPSLIATNLIMCLSGAIGLLYYWINGR